GNHSFELFPGVCVFNRNTRRTFGATQRCRTKFQAAYIENIEGDNMALPDFSQNIFNRHFTILEIELNGGRTLDAHLVFLRAAGEPLKIFFNNERCKFFSIYFGKNSKYI